MNKTTITPAQEIISRWPSRLALCQDLGVKAPVVSQWFTRSSIPARHYVAVLASARKRKIRLTLAELVGAHGFHNCQNSNDGSEIQATLKHSKRGAT